jgi:hypothetical protein
MPELLVTMVLMLVVVSAVTALAVSADRLARTQSLVMDAQQRARVLAETLGRDLRLAGAGVDRGAGLGPLNHAFAPVWPRRVGRLLPDAVTVARADVLTLVYVPDTLMQTTLGAGGVSPFGQVVLSPCLGGVCPLGRGTTLALFDTPGRVELLGVLAPELTGATVRVLAASGGAFAAGSPVTEVIIRSYYFDETAGQLRVYDGDRTDQPVVDGVTALTFEYFGDPEPPRMPRAWPGESNCLYTDAGQWLGGPTLEVDAEGLAPLPLSKLSDGPWCGAGSTVFDADLLRIRRIRVVARLKASGPRDPIPDFPVAFDVAPPNLALSGPPGGFGVSW